MGGVPTAPGSRCSPDSHRYLLGAVVLEEIDQVVVVAIVQAGCVADKRALRINILGAGGEARSLAHLERSHDELGNVRRWGNVRRSQYDSMRTDGLLFVGVAHKGLIIAHSASTIKA